MKKTLFTFALASAVFSGAVSTHAAVKIGAPAPAFTLTDTLGHTHNLSDFAGKVVVLEWINDGCPFVKRHYVDHQNMQALQKKYTAQGVIWLSISSSARGQQGNHSGAGWEAIRQKQSHHSTALLLDAPGTVGRLYGAKTTPHMYIIASNGMLAYNGAIDSNKADVAKADPLFATALDAVLAGQPVAKPTNAPYGCGVKYDS